MTETTANDRRYVEIANLTKAYPNPFGPDIEVVKDFNMFLHRGEVVSVIGHSGCGKSTVLTMLAGLNPVIGDERVPAAVDTEVARGEDLAGRAWRQKSATILQEDPSELLDSLSNKCSTKLHAVLAIPIFSRTDIRGVVVLGLGEGFGGAEIWSRDDRDELSISSSWYSGLESFDFISRYVRFPKGAGMPGQVWRDGKPRLLRDPGSEPNFARSFSQDPADVSSVTGIPCGSSSGFAASVLLLLNSVQNPFASEMEMWTCEPKSPEEDDGPRRANLVQARSSTNSGTLPALNEPADWRQTVVSRIAAKAAPALLAAGDSQLPPGVNLLLAVPVFHDDGLIGVWTLLF